MSRRKLRFYRGEIGEQIVEDGIHDFGDVRSVDRKLLRVEEFGEDPPDPQRVRSVFREEAQLGRELHRNHPLGDVVVLVLNLQDQVWVLDH